MAQAPTHTHVQTTSLPLIIIDAAWLAANCPELGPSDAQTLVLAASAVKHARDFGNTELLTVLNPDELPIRELKRQPLTLEQLDLVLQDPELSKIARSQAPGTLTGEVARAAREIITRKRLYWFDYPTVYWLWTSCEGTTPEERGQAMRGLERLSNIVSRDVTLRPFLKELGEDPRRDPQNNNCLVFNQYQLNRTAFDPLGRLPEYIWGSAEAPNLLALRRLIVRFRTLT